MSRLGGLEDVPTSVVREYITRQGGRPPRPWTPKEQIARFFDSKPYFASWFTRGEKQTVGASATKTELTAFVIPAGCYGVLRFIANACTLNSDYPNITFQLTIDNVPLEGFASVVGPISPSIQSPIPVMEALTSGQRVAWAASNASTAAIAGVQGFFRGWYWMPSQDGGA